MHSNIIDGIALGIYFPVVLTDHGSPVGLLGKAMTCTLLAVMSKRHCETHCVDGASIPACLCVRSRTSKFDRINRKKERFMAR